MLARDLFPGNSRPVIVFIALQALDAASTLAFLHMGVQEANPLVRWSMATFTAPLPGLLLVKSFSAVLGVACYRMNRFDVLRRANMFFCALIAWNLIAILTASVAR